MRTYTEADAAEWIAIESEGIRRGLDQCKQTPEYLKSSEHFYQCWQAGCWMNYKMKEHGATEAEVHQIGFAHGQRCFFGDALKWAVIYLNEFIRTGKVSDKPGVEFADELNAKHLPELFSK
jgi:hypothetical protein